MRIHSASEIAELKRLRKSGQSINELVARLNIPKTTVWHHIHKIKLNKEATRKIREIQGGSKKRKQQNVVLAQKMAKEFLVNKNRELSIVVAMLYWAEGTKEACEFINSDGRMIKLYLRGLREIFCIKNDEIKPTMRIFSGMDEKRCLSHWSRVTDLSKRQFTIRMNDGGQRGNTQFGMCRITVKKGHFVLKVLRALIDEIYNEKHIGFNNKPS